MVDELSDEKAKLNNPRAFIFALPFITEDEMNSILGEVSLTHLAVKRVKLKDLVVGSQSCEVQDKYLSGQKILVLVFSLDFSRNTRFLECFEEDDVEITASLGEVLKKVFNSIDSMQELEAIYHIVSSRVWTQSMNAWDYLQSKSTLDSSRQCRINDSP